MVIFFILNIFVYILTKQNKILNWEPLNNNFEFYVYTILKLINIYAYFVISRENIKKKERERENIVIDYLGFFFLSRTF
jgi:hypothetical protein